MWSWLGAQIKPNHMISEYKAQAKMHLAGASLLSLVNEFSW